MPESVSAQELVAFAVAVSTGLVLVGALFAVYLRSAPSDRDGEHPRRPRRRW